MECFFSLVATFSRTFNPTKCGNCPTNVSDCSRPGCAVGDGSVRPLFLVNEMFPGPEIRVCENDIVTVNVTNMLLSVESLTIHWHGIHHLKTPFMDGTPLVSQCDILLGSTFQYKFEAYPPGTKFWHAHAALLRDQGIAGSFLIRNKFRKSGPRYVSFENDRNRLALVQDWTASLTPPYFVRNTMPTVASLVVNGRQGDFEASSPPSYFVFRPFGQKPYLRVISNGFLFCPISLSIEGHRMTVVEGDNFPFRPVTVDKLYIFAAERFDVFLEPTDPNPIVQAGNSNQDLVFSMSWIGDGVCRNASAGYVGNATSYLIYTRNDDITLEEATALMLAKQTQDKSSNKFLTYANSDLAPRPGEKVFNPVHKADYNTNPAYVRLTDLRALKFELQKPINNPRYRFYLFTDSFIGNGLPNINNISFTHPSFPLLTQFEQIPSSEFCTIERNPECSTKICNCINMYPVALNNVVEIVIVDEGNNLRNDVHSFHLHGYAFAVLGQERLASKTTIEEIKRRDRQGLLKRNFQSPVYKDTVAVPEGGYVILRFLADNPGFWMFHCHLGFHLMGGMSIMFQIGEYEEMVRAPPSFPKCGTWIADEVDL
ncbi:unnamed protein product [Gordionus sp. m RMFG-2023]